MNAVKLRTKLIVAFLLISVVPLAGVTLLSYTTSLRAFRRTVEAEAGSQATEMGQRMASVTEDVRRRVDDLAETPAGQALLAGRRAAVPAPGGFPGNIAMSLGDAAVLLDQIEFRPPPASPGAARGPRTADGSPAIPPAATPPPNGHEVAPGSDSDPDHDSADAAGDEDPDEDETEVEEIDEPDVPEPAAIPDPEQPAGFVFDFSTPEMRRQIEAQIGAARSQIAKQAARNQDDAQRLAALDAASRALELGGLVGPKGGALGADGGRIALQALELEGMTTRAAGAIHAPSQQPSAPPGHRRVVRFLVKRDGHVVGNVHAKINLDRTLGAVLSLARTDQGEIPFAVDAAGDVYTPKESDRAILARLDLPRRAAQSAQTGGALATDDWMVATSRDPSGVTFGIARPVGGPLREIRAAYGRNLALGLAVIALAFVGIVPLSARMTRNLNTLAGGVERISRGDLDARVPVRSKDEFGMLAGAFNRMAEDLAAHEKTVVGRERLKRELELCRQIQSDMLPKSSLRFGVAEIRGVSIPAREVGGDFFNYFVLDSGEIALLVGDVSGKGVGAALLMANVQATLRARLPVDPDLVRLCDAIDRELERSTPREVYLTLFIGLIDPRVKALRYVNAGHNPQYLVGANGALEKMGSTGMPLGLFAGHGYVEKSVPLSEGDFLFFYTDGAIEAENETGEMFGSHRLEPILRGEESGEIDDLLARVEDAVRRFRGGAEPSDDATMMALHVGSAPVANA